MLNKVVFALVFVIVLLSGCNPMLTSGTVIHKQFIPAHSETSITPVMDFDGNFSMSTDTVNVPDRWYVTFEKVDEDNRLKQRTVVVDLETFNQFNEGDWIALGE